MDNVGYSVALAGKPLLAPLLGQVLRLGSLGYDRPDTPTSSRRIQPVGTVPPFPKLVSRLPSRL